VVPESLYKWLGYRSDSNSQDVDSGGDSVMVNGNPQDVDSGGDSVMVNGNPQDVDSWGIQ